MIRVTFYKKLETGYFGFCFKGHAGYAEAGQDIVCAAVSALCINTINSIEAFTKDTFQLESNEKTGMVRLKFTGEISKESKLLMDSLKLGLEKIEQDNYTEYLSVTTREV
ncbi:MAG: ribosomal-processing cysteine protease Prp [Lachnospiraceae bacterium]|nr:ribosomal-processing cysteine protease Prp [Lachnospiraceae bacterium]